MADRTAVAVHPESPVVAEGPGALLSAIVTLAKDPTVDVTKLTALMEMQERMEDRAAEREFNQAFIRLSRNLPRINKRGEVEYKGQKAFKFAKYDDLDAAIRPALDAEGFVISFDTTPRTGDGGGLIVTAILRHEGGHSTRTSIPVPLDSSGGKNNLQGYGSSLSYGKRYAATAALNIVTEDEDDDGKRGGMRFITDEHERELVGLLQETRTNPDAFLQVMTNGARSTSEIEERDFLRLKNALLQKQAKSRTTPPSDPP